MRFIKLSKQFTSKLNDERALKQLKKSAAIFSVSINELEKTVYRFCKEIIQNYEELNKIRKRLRLPEKTLGDYLKAEDVKDLEEAFQSVFNVWKKQRKEIEKSRAELARAEAQKILKLHEVKKDRLFEAIGLERRELIATANELLTLKPTITVILANQIGDVVGMTRNKGKDMNQIIKDICTRAGGSGGGTKDFAQGKAELSKLLKVVGKF